MLKLEFGHFMLLSLDLNPGAHVQWSWDVFLVSASLFSWSGFVPKQKVENTFLVYFSLVWRTVTTV